ncbi:peptidylprolyl isomerase [uncultured Sphingomonas sp.]|uniref:peptidylprolyl isomerase n=1 Tax=uncultured Sphingomonas sp. TaxID=158754 RepID=UPI00258CBB4B|nr:peptidylprolyl isomerase [uncultured Sphingomonas sp.]
MRPFAILAALVAAFVTLPAVAQTTAAAAPVAPPAITDKSNIWVLDLSTGGRVEILLRPDVAPKMVERVKTLTRQHFYDGLVFHRVIDGFMAQGGDPRGDGTGGSQLPDLPAEFNSLPHVRGAVAAARAEKEDSANSQFYIVFQPRFQLDRKYTVFGRVLTGMPYVDAIERGEPPANPSRVIHAYIASDNPPAYAPPPPAITAPATLPTLPGTTPKKAKPPVRASTRPR